ncbi:MAG: STAS domain-containing protein [Chitinivibrionales bacterium]|nr:STAS domain-containing protein [Chitinivibrionales bacterium]
MAVELSSTPFDNYTLCTLNGEITVAEIPSLTPQLSRQLTIEPPQDLIIDLSNITHIDSSAIRLLTNVKKRLEKVDKTLFLLNPSEQVTRVLVKLGLDQSFSIISALDDLRKELTRNRFERYLPFVHNENGLRRLSLACAVCGSQNIAGYLIEPSAYIWRWEEGDPFPTSYAKKDKKPFNVFGLLPIVCNDCGMSSIDLSHFHAAEKDRIEIHAGLIDEIKSILAKSIKQRKRLVEPVQEDTSELFVFPRSKEGCYLAYELARICSRSMAFDKKVGIHFTIGYTTFLTIQFADPSLKDDLINDCRTWFTHVLNDKESYNSLHLAISYFILMNVALHIKKPKEAIAAYNQFTEMMNSLPPETGELDIESPHFWYKQAKNIWHIEIKSRSSEMRL